MPRVSQTRAVPRLETAIDPFVVRALVAENKVDFMRSGETERQFLTANDFEHIRQLIAGGNADHFANAKRKPAVPLQTTAESNEVKEDISGFDVVIPPPPY
jgi:hypothetical protein